MILPYLPSEVESCSGAGAVEDGLRLMWSLEGSEFSFSELLAESGLDWVALVSGMSSSLSSVSPETWAIYWRWLDESGRFMSLSFDFGISASCNSTSSPLGDFNSGPASG